MEKNIALIPGDGIGPDVVAEGVKVLDAIAAKFGHTFTYTEVTAGGAAIDKWGHPLPQDQLDICLNSDAVLLGAVGGPKWDNVAPEIRPEKALLGLRGGMKVYANLRPAVMWKQLKDACPLKDEIVGEGLDILVVRELTGGIYFGERGTSADGKTAWDTEKYTWEEIERIVRMGFEFAQKRQKRLAVVDKANILNSSRLWRKVAEEVHKEYKDVQLDFLYIDNAAMQLVRNPRQFDVIATSNMFGDILTDEAIQDVGKKTAGQDKPMKLLSPAELKRELRPALQKLQRSNIAPVDLAQSAIGPGMGVFSRYRRVLEADGTPMSVRSALQIINQELDIYFNEQDGELDADSRFCVELYTQNAFNDMKFGDADTLARAKNTSVAAMAGKGVLYAQKGSVHLLGRDEVPEKVDTREGCIWLLTQQLAHAMETGGVNACAEIVAPMFGSNGERAKDLAYRLYTIAERRGWAQEAYAYNALVISWPEIQSRAAEIQKIVPEQTVMEGF